MKSLKRPGSGFHSEWIDADGAVAVLDGVDDHAHRGEVVDLVELLALPGHLRVDRVEVLGAAGDLRPDADRVAARAGGISPASLHVALAVVALLGDEPLDLLVLARVQRGEGEVLELPLERVDPQAVRDRRVDLERLAGLLDLLLLGQRVDRAHVVQAVGELDQDDPHVGGHRDDHLAVVLRLRLVARGEGDPGELGDAVDELAISSPKRSRTSSSEAEVSSTVSCSSAAHSVSVSRRIPAQMRATPTGCTMKSSPDLRRCSAWCSQANTNASSTRPRSTSRVESPACSETIAKRSSSRRRSSSLSRARTPRSPAGAGTVSRGLGRTSGMG